MELEDISWSEEQDHIVMRLYKYYVAKIGKDVAEDIGGDYEINDNKITFTKFDEKRSNIRVWRLIAKALKDLTFTINGNKAIFLDEQEGIPLFGLNYIGIVDKGSEMIEVKPLTGCNANCTFCSVDEGLDSKKQVDFVVDKDYLVEELNKLLDIKDDDNKIWINPHGDPTLYTPLPELIKDIAQNPKVSEIMIITNAMLLGKKMADELKAAGLTTVSVSISAATNETGKTIMGTPGYNLDAVLKNIEYAADIGLNIIVAPVYVKGHNDKEMIDIIKRVKPLAHKIGIQKFCHNKMGRNPIKEQSWDEFFEELKDLQDNSGFTLIEPLGKLKETNKLPQPFKKGDVIEVEIKAPSRFLKDKVGVAQERAIHVTNCAKDKGKTKVKLVSAKNNIFVAV